MKIQFSALLEWAGVLVPLLLSFSAHAGDGWFCTEESSRRDGNDIVACGVGVASTENDARSQAFENARTEFSNVCKSSVDCKGHLVKLTPKRTSCESIKTNSKSSAYRCFRALSFEISESRAAIEELAVETPAIQKNGGKQILEVERTESADASDVFNRVIFECKEKVFNKTLGLDPGSVWKPTCSSKSGTTSPYKTLLAFYKLGAALGRCNSFLPEAQATLDSLEAFDGSPETKEQAVANIEHCRHEVQNEREKAIGDLDQCFNVPYISRVIEIANTCGDSQFWSYSGPQYQSTFSRYCMIVKKDKEACARLADESYLNYLIKASKGTLADKFDAYSILTDTLARLRNRPTECANGNGKDCYRLGSEKLTAGSKAEANRYFKKSCEIGYSGGCYLLGLGELESGHHQYARTLLKKACDSDNFNGCFSLGTVEKKLANRSASESAFRRSCQGDNIDGCAFYGADLIDKGKTVEAAGLTKKACEGGSMYGCMLQAMIAHRAGNVELAAEIWGKACTGGVAKACELQKSGGPR